MATVKTTNKAPKAKEAVEVKTLDQLREDVTKLREDQRESLRSHKMGELINPRVITMQRKSIARALTALSIAEKSAKKEEN